MVATDRIAINKAFEGIVAEFSLSSENNLLSENSEHSELDRAICISAAEDSQLPSDKSGKDKPEMSMHIHDNLEESSCSLVSPEDR
jgi:hypothetical protein